MDFITYKGINLFVGWTEDNSVPVESLPTKPGLYAEICWGRHGVRVGETGRSVRGKIRHDIRWFEGMHNGTEKPEQLRRTSPICMAAKELGVTGFRFYLVSDDPRLNDKILRQECERFLFEWCEKHAQLISWNFQKSWR
ncbi:hypothetical protein MPL1_02433 [Methylophaga lonarensis MPL]|uniref:Uncharacterized protein n=1 Tax=Methylophaga lonarensis MPL TaxID=1286106 RepID=M7P384_9GAMM|nr:hypothetical protein MPL1_02433 [Methylophaga lonarensis MPL]